MKKLLSLLLILVMVLSIFAGCGSGDTTNDTNNSNAGDNSTDSGKTADGDRPVLNVSVFAQEHEQEMYRKVIADFEEEYNVTVNFK